MHCTSVRSQIFSWQCRQVCVSTSPQCQKAYNSSPSFLLTNILRCIWVERQQTNYKEAPLLSWKLAFDKHLFVLSSVWLFNAQMPSGAPVLMCSWMVVACPAIPVSCWSCYTAWEFCPSDQHVWLAASGHVLSRGLRCFISSEDCSIIFQRGDMKSKY